MSMTPLEEIRHSCSHVLAAAVLRLFPDTQLDIGPPTDAGFYYDFDLAHKFTQEDLEKIEAEMKKVIAENQKFIRHETSREEAVTLIKEIGQERYKLGRLEDIPEGDSISFYQNGEFRDLCAGSHVNYSKKIKAFKLLSVAGAYHRGDEKNKQLQRIYGTAFPNKAELADHLEKLEQAKARDHRKIGRDLKLFHIDEAVGQGLVLWTPNGAIIRQELQTFISEELDKQGYSQVFTPHIGKLELYKTSGHFPYYSDSQYPPIVERETMEGLPAQADELPAPYQDFRQPAPLLPRSARPDRGVWDGLPMGTIRRIERDDARARFHPGRCPPLLHRGTSGRRIVGMSVASQDHLHNARDE
jgi:threonyl-tRNA synthetase